MNQARAAVAAAAVKISYKNRKIRPSLVKRTKIRKFLGKRTKTKSTKTTPKSPNRVHRGRQQRGMATIKDRRRHWPTNATMLKTTHDLAND